MVCEGEFTVDKKAKTVFLLNDSFLILQKSKKVKAFDWFPLSVVSLFSLNQDGDESRRLLAFDVYRSDLKRSINFVAKSTEDKAKWVSLVDSLKWGKFSENSLKII